jgi:hypothetical protein
MDGVGAGKLGDANDLVDRKIALDRPEIAGKMRSAADLIAFVRLEAVQREFVFLGPDGHRFYAKLIGRTEHADGDFGTVGNQDLGYGQVRSPHWHRNGQCCTREEEFINFESQTEVSISADAVANQNSCTVTEISPSF